VRWGASERLDQGSKRRIEWFLKQKQVAMITSHSLVCFVGVGKENRTCNRTRRLKLWSGVTGEVY